MQKLLTNPGNFRAFKILIAAEYNGVDIQVPAFDLAKQGKSPDFLSKSPAGKVPALETPQGNKKRASVMMMMLVLVVVMMIVSMMVGNEMM